jgi:hypothetical protein
MINSLYINLNDVENNYFNLFFDNVTNNNFCKKITGLMDLNKKDNLCFIEKIIHELSEYHLKETKCETNNNFYAEFWIKNNKNTTPNFHLDKDERAKNKYENVPFLSCILYLNDCKIPTIITNKTIDNDYFDQMTLSFPKKMKSICFEGGKYYHGIIAPDDINTIDRNILVINIWKNYKPKDVPEFKMPTNFLNIQERCYNNSDKILELTKSSNMTKMNINENFFKYKKPNDSNGPHFFKNNNEILNLINKLSIEKECDIFILNCEKHNICHFKKFFHKNTCTWIVNESENYAKHNGWQTNRHKLYPTTDIVIFDVKHISIFFDFIINKIKKLIIELFKISTVSLLYIFDAFIVKYEADKQNELGIHTDSSDYTVNIALSDLTDYEGGGVFFEHINQTVSCEIGDILIHHGNLKHAGIKITKGKRYVLVVFLKLTT